MTGLYLIFILAAMGISALVQQAVKSRFEKWGKVRPSSGLTGAQAARRMLQHAGIDNVTIERSEGFLTDHYDPRKKVVRLSPHVHDEASISSVAVACHEVGHAMQDANKYAPLVIRNLAVPMAGVGSQFGFILIFIGLILNAFNLAVLGLILFAGVVFFQLINLPVEFNASARAKDEVLNLGIVGGTGDELMGVTKVLNAAAMTYVLNTLIAVVQLGYFALLVFGRR